MGALFVVVVLLVAISSDAVAARPLSKPEVVSVMQDGCLGGLCPDSGGSIPYTAYHHWKLPWHAFAHICSCLSLVCLQIVPDLLAYITLSIAKVRAVGD